MLFQIQCPCGKILSVDRQHAGQQIECPECRQRLVVPNASPTPAAPPQPTPPPTSIPRPAVPPPQSAGMQPPPPMHQQGEGRNTGMIVGMISIAVVAVVVVALAGLYVMQNSNRQNVANGNEVAEKSDEEKNNVVPEKPVKRTVVDPKPAESKPKIPSAGFTVPTYSEKAAPPSLSKPKSLADLIEAIEPSVVRLDVEELGGGSVGSGFFVGETGIIVTNFHVVQGARRVKVTTNDGNETFAQGFYYATPKKDLAVIQVNPDKINIKPLPLAPRLPRKGDDVAAFGSPLGFSFSTTQGIVSSIRTGTEIQKTLITMSGEDVYRELGYAKSTNWLQTSAAISGGNSGGPLVNMQGELVGVNTWTTPKGQNLNFASTVDEVKSVLKTAEGKSLQPFNRLPGQRIVIFLPRPGGRGRLIPGGPGIPGFPRIPPRGGIVSKPPSSPRQLTPEEVEKMTGTESVEKGNNETFTKASSKATREFTLASRVVDIDLSADESLLAVVGEDGQVLVFDFKAGGRLLYKIKSDGKLIRQARFTAAPLRLVTLRDQGLGNCISFRDPLTGVPEDRTATNPGSAKAKVLSVSSDGLSVFGGYESQRACRFWRFEPGSKMGRPWLNMFGKSGRIPESSVVSANNQFLVTGFVNGEVVVATGTGLRMKTFTEGRVHNGRVTGVAVNKESNRMFTAGEDGRLVATGFKAKNWTLKEFSGGGSSPIYGMDLSGDDKWLVAARGDQSLELYNARTRKRTHRVETRSQATKVLLMNESRFGVAAESSSVRIYKLQ